MDKFEFMTLARFSSVEEAQVMKTFLDSAGIENQITNDTSQGVLPVFENSIKIIVNSGDYKKAVDILNAKFDKTEMKEGWKEK